MMMGLPRVVALKYLKSAGKCHGMLLSTPITRFSPRAAIRLRGSVFSWGRGYQSDPRPQYPVRRRSGYALGSLEWIGL
jgi:hypothetical protein